MFSCALSSLIYSIRGGHYCSNIAIFGHRVGFHFCDISKSSMGVISKADQVIIITKCAEKWQYSNISRIITQQWRYFKFTTLNPQLTGNNLRSVLNQSIWINFNPKLLSCYITHNSNSPAFKYRAVTTPLSLRYYCSSFTDFPSKESTVHKQSESLVYCPSPTTNIQLQLLRKGFCENKCMGDTCYPCVMPVSKGSCLCLQAMTPLCKWVLTSPVESGPMQAVESLA